MVVGSLGSWSIDQLPSHIRVESRICSHSYVGAKYIWRSPSLSMSNHSRSPPTWRLASVTRTWPLIPSGVNHDVDSSLRRPPPQQSRVNIYPHIYWWSSIYPIVLVKKMAVDLTRKFNRPITDLVLNPAWCLATSLAGKPVFRRWSDSATGRTELHATSK